MYSHIKNNIQRTPSKFVGNPTEISHPIIHVTKWCLCASRCFNKTHYLAGSYFIDG